ncbi:MAG TPA: PIG-L deacetylase family protein [Thermoanaerobaculia bacterium]|nr:PIG-L deacetylase family protein [Thermoanaerobaculia bacterium]HXT51090.1 PIG-L deacetylase family protein [Thermoanaerobaculia bacterium]
MASEIASSSGERGWVARTHALLRRLASGDRTDMRVMVLTAHPADESLGAAGLLSRLKDPWVVCLTDGAPRDRRFVPAGCPASPSGYAKRRRQEMRAALSLAGVGVDRVLQLDVPDQEAALSLCKLVHRLTTLARGLRPHLLITHGYEGGHPDHDAAALAARLAVERLERQEGAAPALAEMLSYHREEDRLVADRFLPASTDRWTVLLRLSPRERRLRRDMLACHASQVATMVQLPERPWERLRPAPHYDFLRPPHEGPLQYEVLGFALDGRRWRELAAEAIAAEREDEMRQTAS